MALAGESGRMALGDVIDRIFHRRLLRRWRHVAGSAEGYEPERLRAVRNKARAVRRVLDRVIYISEGRLTLPSIGSNAIIKPLYTEADSPDPGLPGTRR